MILTKEQIMHRRDTDTIVKSEYLYSEGNYLDTIADLQRQLTEAQAEVKRVNDLHDPNWNTCMELKHKLETAEALLAPSPCPFGHPIKYWVAKFESAEDRRLDTGGKPLTPAAYPAVDTGYCLICKEREDAVAAAKEHTHE